MPQRCTPLGVPACMSRMYAWHVCTATTDSAPKQTQKRMDTRVTISRKLAAAVLFVRLYAGRWREHVPLPQRPPLCATVTVQRAVMNLSAEQCRRGLSQQQEQQGFLRTVQRTVVRLLLGIVPYSYLVRALVLVLVPPARTRTRKACVQHHVSNRSGLLQSIFVLYP